MKICYLANSRFPSERAHMTQIVQMCNAFAQHGHEVTLLVTDRRTDIAQSPELFFGVPFSFSVVRVAVPDVAGRAPRIPSFLRPYLFFIQRIAFVYQSMRYISKNKYTHLYGRDEWILWFLSFLVSVPIVWESHEARTSPVSRKLLRKVSRVVVISEGLRKFYIGTGVSPENILVAHDAVDARFFEPHISPEVARLNLGITTKKPVVLYIGEFDTWKGVHTLFEASKNQDIFDVYVIGGKEYEVSQLATQYPRVHFLGRRPYRELPQHQQAADILVIPNTAKNSLSAEYTSPLKLFAYMTARKPIVASHIESITSILSSEDAFFFKADSVEDLRNTIAFVVTHPSLAQEKVACVCKKSRMYSWNNRAGVILDYISKMR